MLFDAIVTPEMILTVVSGKIGHRGNGVSAVSWKERKKRKASGGQVLTEYVAMLVMAIAIVFVLLLLLAVFAEYNWRITALLGWEP